MLIDVVQPIRVKASAPGETTGAKPTFIECAHSTAATDTPRSATRALVPATWVKASVNSGCHDITSRTSSGRSTRGIIAATRARRSVRLGGSGTAVNAATCSFPSSSTEAGQPPPTRS